MKREWTISVSTDTQVTEITQELSEEQAKLLQGLARMIDQAKAGPGYPTLEIEEEKQRIQDQVPNDRFQEWQEAFDALVPGATWTQRTGDFWTTITFEGTEEERDKFTWTVEKFLPEKK